MDGLGADIFKCSGAAFLQSFTNLLVKVWKEELVPQEWKDALMTLFYKVKDAKDDCNNSRGIALLCTAGKMVRHYAE